MKELRYTGQFKKDLKRILNQPKYDEKNDIIALFRLGSHSELFKK